MVRWKKRKAVIGNIKFILQVITIGCALFLSLFIAIDWHIAGARSKVDQASVRGSMNVIIYYRHKHHEPRTSWLIMAAQQPGAIADTDEAVNNLELKADVWESEHYVKEIK